MNYVFRCYAEKRPGFDVEAGKVFQELREQLGISRLEGVRIFCRYDVDGVEYPVYLKSRTTVFSEPMCDAFYDEQMPQIMGEHSILAVESLPGQFDQRADSCAQCIQLLAGCERPIVRCATIYVLMGKLTDQDLETIRGYLINPVETREASMDKPETLAQTYDIPTSVATLTGFRDLDEAGLREMLSEYGLAMDLNDLKFLQSYFREEEKRDPTITELRLVDTYWSDHCRHTTFGTHIDAVDIQDPEVQKAYEAYLAGRVEVYGPEKAAQRPQTLMDVGTLGAKVLKKRGELPNLDESEEINACSIHIPVDVDGQEQDWLLMFKNETHNHPTEIEPFGGAATCIGGAIRDPLSGRAYVYQAMRLTGCGDPRAPMSETLAGKLPQRKLATTAAAGYSSYGNQIGLATGLVNEFYHPGYVAKHMELGAVVGAAPADNVVREQPAPGDVVILLGGRTGRDGIGGATGSSKSHNKKSLQTMASEVQKGNAPEERKIQRLFRDGNVTRMIKRCNDFGAGGVSVAIGELAQGLEIALDAVPKKYEGLDGTELAISESQERMAVVVAPEDAARFLKLAAAENLEATVVAEVTAEQRLKMRWRGDVIVDISREFLDSNGAEKHMRVAPAAPQAYEREAPADFAAGMEALAEDLNVCSKRGLGERFDATIGAGTVLMPFGGKNQLTPIQTMVQKVSLEKGETDTCTAMAWGYNPYITEKSPYHGAYLAVVESVSKLVATGAEFSEVYLSFQEYFEKLRREPARWGKPFAALLGAFQAQMDLGVAAIGGKDSMSGSFEELDVPPTLVSFAVTPACTGEIVSPELKEAGHRLAWLRPETDENGLPKPASLLETFNTVYSLLSGGQAVAAWTPQYGGAAEGLLKMALGNGIGVDISPEVSLEALFGYAYGSFLLELTPEAPMVGTLLGYTQAEEMLTYGGASVSLQSLLARYEAKLEPVYPTQAQEAHGEIPAFAYGAANTAVPRVSCSRPRVLIPVFPGTNCEYDTARAFEAAGAAAEVFVIRNLTSQDIARSVEDFARRIDESQIVFLPGGFSGGDEPDGSAKFITAFFRNAQVRAAVERLLEGRGGLMGGICNGFQALIKLGLVPYGRITDATETSPTLTFNTIGRHQSRLVRTRVCANTSPWLRHTQVGEIYTVPISHGEGRFLAEPDEILALAEAGQIATQYVDLDGAPTGDIRFNPNGSMFAVEGITSPDGRVLGKMGHSERVGPGLYKNVPGRYEMGLFRSAVEYFRQD